MRDGRVAPALLSGTVMPVRPFAPLLLLGTAVTILLGGAEGGCGMGSAASPPVAAAMTPGLRWIGVDSKPLAVGSRLTVSFEAGGAASCCAGGYRVESSDPSVVEVADEGNQTLALDAVASGEATIQVFPAGSATAAGSTDILTRDPASVQFADPSHLAAAIADDTELPAAFALLRTGAETIQAVVRDAGGEVLASSGLAAGSGSGAIVVVPEQPDQFYLTALPASGSGTGSFTGGLSGGAGQTFQVAIVGAPVSAALEHRVASDGSIVVLARALAADGSEVFGVPAWIFNLAGPGTALSIADAAVQLSFPAGTPSGAAILTATSGALTAEMAVP